MVPSLMELRVKQGLEPETDDHKGLMKELQLSGLFTGKRTEARQTSEWPTGVKWGSGVKVGPDPQAHLSLSHALFCLRDLAFIILSKGIAEACLREGSDLSCSAARALPNSVTTTVRAVSA